MDECVEVMRLGFGMPALNNDEIIIPSFMDWQVKEEDAYNYSAIGCVDVIFHLIMSVFKSCPFWRQFFPFNHVRINI